jgi:two-component system catabolic regulation response regulator CreB
VGGIDLVILDVGLPDRSGFEVCRDLRTFSAVPVVFLTARDDEIDRVLGLELGADDYMAKPFSPRELVARVRARLRRHEGRRNPAGRRAASRSIAKATASATPATALDHDPLRVRLLHELLRRPGAMPRRAQLLDRAWADALESGERTVDTHVKTLRAKLRALEWQRDPIRTHRGLGYSITSVD